MEKIFIVLFMVWYNYNSFSQEAHIDSVFHKQPLKEVITKIPDSLSGLYLLSDKNSQSLIKEIIINNSSCSLFRQDGSLYDKINTIKLEYSANRNVAAKFRVRRFKLSLLFSKKMYVRDNLCMDCPEILFDRKH